jgi:hypothetical protein
VKKELKKAGGKLKIHRETLRALGQEQLADIAGGLTLAACATNNHFRCTTGC